MKLVPSGQVVAIALAFAADAFIVISGPDGLHLLRNQLFLVLVLVCAAATLALPSRPHRRWVPLLIALFALPAIGYLNTHIGITALVLMVILEVRCTLAFGFRGGAIVGLFAVIMFAIGVDAQMSSLGAHGHLPQSLIVLITIVALALPGALLVFVGVFANSLRSERTARAELQAAQQQLREYAQHAAARATLEERARVALDLHDALGHGLTTLSVQLQSVERLRGRDDEKAQAFLRLANGTALSLLADLRETVAVLRDRPEGVAPFSTLVETLFSDFSRSDLLEFRWSVVVSHEPPHAASLTFLRVLQEALTNVARHAGARHLDASVVGDAQQVTAIIQDDGHGFSPTANPPGNGLSSMRERLASLGGQFRVESTEGGGTTLHATMPLHSS
jgi:signal transduction histidine kinase